MEVLLVLLLALYFLPTIIAASRNHHSGTAIFAFNLLLGWTLLGWVLALVWSLAYVIPEAASKPSVSERRAVVPEASPNPIVDARPTRPISHAVLANPVPAFVIVGLAVAGGLIGQHLAKMSPASTPEIAPAAPTVTATQASYAAQSEWAPVNTGQPKTATVRAAPATKPAAPPPSNVNKVVQDIGVGLTTAAQRRDYINETRVRVRNKMRDPSSVTFKDTFFSGTSGMPLTCGWVNGKNASGRYIGFKKFIATAGEKGIVLIDDGTQRYWILGEQLPTGGQQDIENSWNRFCVERK